VDQGVCNGSSGCKSLDLIHEYSDLVIYLKGNHAAALASPIVIHVDIKVLQFQISTWFFSLAENLKLLKIEYSVFKTEDGGLRRSSS
jgi:hypothetical protein